MDMVNSIFEQVNKLKSGLDASWIRNELLTNNIANVNTPNFKRSDISFSSIMEQTLDVKTTTEKHIKIVEQTDTKVRMDNNNVDIEYEMAEMAKNTIWYNFLSKKISDEFEMLNMAISGGK